MVQGDEALPRFPNRIDHVSSYIIGYEAGSEHFVLRMYKYVGSTVIHTVARIRVVYGIRCVRILRKHEHWGIWRLEAGSPFVPCSFGWACFARGSLIS